MTDLASGATRSEPNIRRFSTVFLDRDGTVNVKAIEGQYVTSPGDSGAPSWSGCGNIAAQRRFGSGHTCD